MSLGWLVDIGEYIKNKSYGIAAIRVLDYNNITFGIIEPYGYYLINYNSEIYLMRDVNICIKFRVKNKTVTTSIIKTGRLNIAYIDSLFSYPPVSSSKIEKFILTRDKNPHKHTAISLINKCLDMCIFHL